MGSSVATTSKENGYKILALHTFTKEKIILLLESVQRCLVIVQTLKELLKKVSDLNLSDNNNYVMQIDNQIYFLENEIGYDLFITLCVKKLPTTNGKALRPSVLEIIKGLQDGITPRYKWDNNNRHIYKDDIENIFLTFDDQAKNKTVNIYSDDIKKRVDIDPKHLLIIKNLNNPEYSRRSPEVYEMLVNILLRDYLKKSMGVEINITFNNWDDFQNKEDSTKNEKQIQLDGEKHIKELFNTYYNQISNSINEEKDIPIVPSQDPLWQIALEKTVEFGNALINLKSENNLALLIYNLNAKDRFLEQLRDFLVTHKFGEQEIPTIRQIRNIKPRGPTFAKKIGEGVDPQNFPDFKGMPTIKMEYKKRFGNINKPEIIFKEKGKGKSTDEQLTKSVKELNEFSKKHNIPIPFNVLMPTIKNN